MDYNTPVHHASTTPYTGNTWIPLAIATGILVFVFGLWLRQTLRG